MKYSLKNIVILTLLIVITFISINVAKADINEQLYLNVKLNNYENVKSAIKLGGDVNYKDKFGDPLLILASAKGFLQIVELLIDNDANVNNVNFNGETALIIAATNNNLDLVKLLINEGANIDQADNKGFTPLLAAVIKNNFEIVKELLDENANVNKCDKNGINALIHSIKNDNNYMTEFLIAENADLNYKDYLGNTALIYSVIENKDSANIILINKKADLNIRNNNGQTALILASKKNDLIKVKRLIENGSDINIQSIDGKTALHWVCINNNDSIYKKLKNYKINYNLKDSIGNIPIYYAIESNAIEIFNDMLDKISINVTNNESKNLLLWSIQNRNLSVSNELINKNINLDYYDNNGFNALIYACKNNLLELVSRFFDKININYKDFNGWTALMHASYEGNTKIVDLLLHNKANINLKNNNQENALELAEKNGKDDVVELLKKYHYSDDEIFLKALDIKDTNFIKILIRDEYYDINRNIIIDTLNNQTQTPLMFVIYHQYYDLVDFLLQNGANPNIASFFNDIIINPITMFAKNEMRNDTNFETIKKLVNYGSTLNEYPDYETTPLIEAVKNSNLKLIEFLLKNGSNINIPDKNEKLPIAYALENSLTPISYKLLDNNGINKEKKLFDEIAKLLLKYSNNQENKYEYFEYALYYAAINGKYEIVKLLLDSNVNSNQILLDNKSVLMSVCELTSSQRLYSNYDFFEIDSVNYATEEFYNDLYKVIELLLQKNADVNYSDGKNTALSLALSNKLLNIAELLIKKGADLDFKNEYSVPIIFFPILYDKLELLKLFVMKNANLEIRNSDGFTPLIYATICRNKEIVEYLLKNKVNVNSQDNKGFTALVYAIQYLHIDCFNILLKQKIDLRLRSFTNSSLLQIVEENKSYEIFETKLNNSYFINNKFMPKDYESYLKLYNDIEVKLVTAGADRSDFVLTKGMIRFSKQFNSMKKIRIIFKNLSNIPINRIKCIVKLYDNNDNNDYSIYEKQHIVNIKLLANEEASTSDIELYNEVYFTNPISENEVKFEIIVMQVW